MVKDFVDGQWNLEGEDVLSAKRLPSNTVDSHRVLTFCWYTSMTLPDRVVGICLLATSDLAKR